MSETFHPTILIDTREQKPLVFKQLPSQRGTLTTGDYSIFGAEELFAVERKTISDLVGSCTTERERFERELHRLCDFHFVRLLIVGTEAEIEQHRYRSNASPRSILHSLWAFEARYNVPVVFEPLPERAARLIERWSFWFARELRNTA